MNKKTDALLRIQPLHCERWTKRNTGFHVYLQTTCDLGPFGTPGPYTFVGRPLRHGRVFDTLDQALLYAWKYAAHIEGKYRQTRIFVPGQAKLAEQARLAA